MVEATDQLRPAGWDDFVGQERMKRLLDVAIEAAITDQRPLESVLLTGPKGFGKTSFAYVIAARLGEPVMSLLVPSLNKRSLTMALLRFEWGIIFLDELHAAPKTTQEMLLTAVEDGWVPDLKGRPVHLGNHTFIAATTERDKIIGPLLDRFILVPDLEDYTDEQVAQILYGMATRVGVDLDPDTALKLGYAAGGTPRNARRLVLAARDLATVGERVSAETVLGLCNIEPDGLTADHMRYMGILDELQLAGMDTIKSLMQMPSASVTELERLLLSRSYLDLTPSGRMLTPQGRARYRGPIESVRRT